MHLSPGCFCTRQSNQAPPNGKTASTASIQSQQLLTLSFCVHLLSSNWALDWWAQTGIRNRSGGERHLTHTKQRTITKDSLSLSTVIQKDKVFFAMGVEFPDGIKRRGRNFFLSFFWKEIRKRLKVSGGIKKNLWTAEHNRNVIKLKEPIKGW